MTQKEYKKNSVNDCTTRDTDSDKDTIDLMKNICKQFQLHELLFNGCEIGFFVSRKLSRASAARIKLYGAEKLNSPEIDFISPP
jgi:hypothetical protein